MLQELPLCLLLHTFESIFVGYRMRLTGSSSVLEEQPKLRVKAAWPGLGWADSASWAARGLAL